MAWRGSFTPQRRQNLRRDTIRVAMNRLVFKAQHAITLRRQIQIARTIISRAVIMGDAIALNDQTVRHTDKVNGVNANRVLTPKLETG